MVYWLWGLAFGYWLLAVGYGSYVVLCEVFDSRGETVADQLGKKLFELEVKLFARDVGIGGHME